MNRILFIISLLMSVVQTSFSQSVRLQAPDVCESGTRVRVSYVVDTQDVEDIEVGDFPGFDVLYGPSTSTQSSFQMINGKTTRSSSVTFTYLLLAKKEGEHKLPAARVKVGGKYITSSTASINVLPATSAATQQHGNAGKGGTSGSARNSSGNIDTRDLFMTATLSKTKIYEQEAVLLTYKLYTLVNVRQLSGEMPELNGFHCQELESKSQYSLKYEHYNGRNYGTAIWRQYVLFPQKSGKLTIPSVSFDAEVEITNTSADPFDVFFGGGSLTQMVRKTIHTPSLEVNVSPLPSPSPEGFTGAVGQFTMTGSLSPKQINANDAATLRLVVSGQGNMKLMKSPTLNAPKDFEVYTPKETDKTSITTAGVKGSVTYDYVIVPRHGGQYEIEPVNFIYFNPSSGKYETLHTDSFHLSVAKGSGVARSAVTEKEDLRVISSDIHYIKTRRAIIRTSVDDFFGTLYYWLVYVALSLLFLIVLVVFYRQVKANADFARRRAGRAGREAAKRLKQAHKLLKNHQANPFYDETFRALLCYAGDKLGIPMTDLTKDNLQEVMTARGVSDELIRQYIEVLESCEFARFAPGDPDATMDKIYDSATQAINDLNKQL